MIRRIAVVCGFAIVASVSTASAQATGTPSFNAPNRAFEKHEFGATFSLPSGAPEWAAEGQFRFGHKKFDIGLKGGLE